MTAETPQAGKDKALRPPGGAALADVSGTAPVSLDNKVSPGAPKPFAVSNGGLSSSDPLPQLDNRGRLPTALMDILPKALPSLPSTAGNTPNPSASAEVGTIPPVSPRADLFTAVVSSGAIKPDSSAYAPGDQTPSKETPPATNAVPNPGAPVDIIDRHPLDHQTTPHDDLATVTRPDAERVINDRGTIVYAASAADQPREQATPAQDGHEDLPRTAGDGNTPPGSGETPTSTPPRASKLNVQPDPPAPPLAPGGVGKGAGGPGKPLPPPDGAESPPGEPDPEKINTDELTTDQALELIASLSLKTSEKGRRPSELVARRRQEVFKLPFRLTAKAAAKRITATSGIPATPTTVRDDRSWLIKRGLVESKRVKNGTKKRGARERKKVDPRELTAEIEQIKEHGLTEVNSRLQRVLWLTF